MRSALLALIIAAFLINGCIQKADVTSGLRNERVSTEIAQTVNLNNCLVFVCQEKISFFGLGKSLNLSGGNCNFTSYNIQDQNRMADFNKLLAQDIGKAEGQPYVRMFLLGSGNSIAAADEAQRLCGGQLGFAMLNIGGYGGNPIRVLTDADIDSFSCALNENIIPIIAYGAPIGDTTVRMADRLSGIGPAIIAPGFGYSQISQIPDPSAEFAKAKSGCPNCLTMAVVNLGDNQTLAHYNGAGAMRNIDIIGFTINASESADCDQNTIESDARDFANNITIDWKKPSMVAGIYGMASQNSAKSCEWDEDSLTGLYELMITAVPELSAAGVIGMIGPDPTSFQSDISSNGWFFNCANYQSIDGDYQTPALFSLAGDEQPSMCTNSLNTNLISQYNPPEDYSKVSVTPVNKGVSCGDACSNIKGYQSSGQFDSTNCEKYRLMIRHFSSQSGFDPSVVMALIDARAGYADAISAMRTYYPHCSCDAYSGQAQSICCGVQTLSYYYSVAKQKITGSSKIDEYNKMYLAVLGYMAGENALNSESNAVGGSDFTYNSLVTAVLGRVSSARSLCGICK